MTLFADQNPPPPSLYSPKARTQNRLNMEKQKKARTTISLSEQSEELRNGGNRDAWERKQSKTSVNHDDIRKKLIRETAS